MSLQEQAQRYTKNIQDRTGNCEVKLATHNKGGIGTNLAVPQCSSKQTLKNCVAKKKNVLQVIKNKVTQVSPY